jgi:hypothetical protein
MGRVEFAKVMAYISAAIGKPMSADSAEVYYDLLGDVPDDVLRTAAKRVCLEHKWANFPTVAELREAASEIQRGFVKELSAAEAWEMAWRAAGRIDLEQNNEFKVKDSTGQWKSYSSQAAYVLDGLPPVVLESIRSFGLAALCYGKEPVTVVRGQFLKIFEQLTARDRRRALLPAAVVDSIERIGAANKLTNQIGRMLDAEM